MDYQLKILVLLLGIASLAYSSLADTNELSNTNFKISQETEPYDLAKERKILLTEQQEQETYQAKLAEIQSRIDLLGREVATGSASAKSAHESVESLRSHFLSANSILRDPWREIYGEKKFMMSSDPDLVVFKGQILEVAENGIRVFGQFGDAADMNTEYFVVNFPYDFKVGESVDPTKVYMALKDGIFSYISEDGYAKSLPKLNYGKPCARPSNADVIEQSTLQFQISAAEQNAKVEDEIVMAAQRRLQAARDELTAVQNEAAEKMKSAIEQALKYDQMYADRGNIDALRRMKDRYCTGDGVQIDTNKAAEYERKFEIFFHKGAEQIAERNRIVEQEALRQKFSRNLAMMDKHADAECALYIEKCYRYGLGTQKDLSKADEYHAKAVSLGIPEQPNRSPLVTAPN
jgi:hypothetical protein